MLSSLKLSLVIQVVEWNGVCITSYYIMVIFTRLKYYTKMFTRFKFYCSISILFSEPSLKFVFKYVL